MLGACGLFLTNLSPPAVVGSSFLWCTKIDLELLSMVALTIGVFRPNAKKQSFRDLIRIDGLITMLAIFSTLLSDPTGNIVIGVSIVAFSIDRALMFHKHPFTDIIPKIIRNGPTCRSCLAL
jgi:hypothetical protein